MRALTCLFRQIPALKRRVARWLVAMAGLLAASLPGWSAAAGLGELTVQSALGQPLAARIEIIALRPKEFESLGIKVAGPDTYQQRGLPYPSPVRQIRAQARLREDGTAYVALSSSAPFNEPSIELLIDFSWPGGQLVQRYPLVLDLSR